MQQYANNKIPVKNIEIYNDIYNLGITDTEKELFEALWTTFKGASFSYIYSAGTGNRDFILKFNEYDESMQLEDTDSAAKQYGYRLFRLKNKRYYLKFLPKSQDLKYLNLLGDITERDQQTFVFTTVDELRDHVFTTDLFGFLGNTALTLDKVETIYWLCGKLSQFKPSLYSDPTKYIKMPEYVYYIIDVLQLPDDTRIALYAERTTNWRSTMNGVAVRAYITRPDNAAYNWTDPDRFFSHIDKKTGHGRAYYVGPNPEFPTEAALSRYVRGHTQVVIENQTLEMISKRDQRKQIEDAAMQSAQSSIQKKLTDKIEELEKGGEFSFNEVTFRTHEIEYEEQIIVSKDIKVKYLLGNFTRNLNDDSFNFERIYEQFCNELIKAAQKSGKSTAKIGSVDVVVEVRSKPNTNGVVMVTNYVNDYRINKDELVDVLLRALCYAKTSDFENYLESVSKCSLRYHRVIASGIPLKVNDAIAGQTIEFKIGLDRDKNRNYISFGDNIRYSVKDSNKLLNLIGATDMLRVINVLVDPDIVGVTGKDIKYIIETGRIALENERKKEAEMLEQAITLFGCQKVEEALLDNGRVVSGYTVKGKLREYLIETSTIRVFEYPTGKYLCMVDKGQNEHANIARLVSRMFALANDSKLAQEITTLQTK
jgi:hypothetical protein